MKRRLPMMFLLSLNVTRHGRHPVTADGERAKPPLPSKCGHVQLLVEPVGRCLFHLADDRRRSLGRIESAEEVDMILVSARVNVGHAELASGRGDIRVDARANRRREGWSPTPRREDDVKINRCVRVHGPLRPMQKSPPEWYLGRGLARDSALFWSGRLRGRNERTDSRAPRAEPGAAFCGAPPRRFRSVLLATDRSAAPPGLDAVQRRSKPTAHAVG
jgi:hypothetical protein